MSYHFERVSGPWTVQLCFLQQSVVIVAVGGAPQVHEHVTGVIEARDDSLSGEWRQIHALHVDHVTPRNVAQQ